LSDNMDDIHFVWNWTEFAVEPLRNWHCMGITGNWAGILGNDAIKKRDSRIATHRKKQFEIPPKWSYGIRSPLGPL
jgi:hypothetical protein